MKIDNHKPTHELLNLFFNNGIIPTIIKPTRITSSTAPLIDNIYTKINNVTNITSGIIISDISDHLPIFACINKNKRTKHKPLQIKTRSFTAEAMAMIKNSLEKTNWTQL